jgi:hypothetical protein
MILAAYLSLVALSVLRVAMLQRELAANRHPRIRG